MIPLSNGPPQPTSSSHDGLVVHNRSGAPLASMPAQNVTMYSPTLPAYTVPPPSTGQYQPQNVFVTNVTANVHTMPHHYVQPYPGQEPEPRGNRGRGRTRLVKRNEGRMDAETSTAQYPPQYPPMMYYHPAYYQQPMGSPIQPNPQAFITPHVYSNIYGGFAPQYYQPPLPPPMGETPEIADMNLHNQQMKVYEQQISEEEYEQHNVVTTVIVNSNIDPKTNNVYINNNNNHVKVDNVTIEKQVQKTNVVKSATRNDTINNTSVTIKTERSVSETSDAVVSSDSVIISPAPVNKSPVPDPKANIIIEPINLNNNNSSTNNNNPKSNATEPVSSDKVNAIEAVIISNNAAAAAEPKPVETLSHNFKAENCSIKTAVAENVTNSSHKTAATNEPVKINNPTVIPEAIKTEIVQSTPPASKSWASLFNKSNSAPADCNATSNSKSPAKIETELVKPDEEKHEAACHHDQKPMKKKSVYTNDPVSHRMGGELLSIIHFQ